MNRSVRRSRFQVGSLEEGEPRPVYRRLTFVSAGSGTALADSTPSVGDAVHAGFMAARPVKALMSETAAVCTPCLSALTRRCRAACCGPQMGGLC